MKMIVTDACAFQVLPAPGSQGVGGVAQLSPDVVAGSAMAGGAGVLAGPLNGVLNGVVSPGGYVQPTPLPFTILPSATKVMLDGKPVLLAGDKVTVSVPLAGPAGATAVMMEVSVFNAGQLSVGGL